MATRSARELDAQQGVNSNCVDCGEIPWHGGMRCWDCFKRRVDERALPHDHRFEMKPSASSYARGCRCTACRAIVAAQRKAQRRRRSAG